MERIEFALSVVSSSHVVVKGGDVAGADTEESVSEDLESREASVALPGPPNCDVTRSSHAGAT